VPPHPAHTASTRSLAYARAELISVLRWTYKWVKWAKKSLIFRSEQFICIYDAHAPHRPSCSVSWGVCVRVAHVRRLCVFPEVAIHVQIVLAGVLPAVPAGVYIREGMEAARLGFGQGHDFMRLRGGGCRRAGWSPGSASVWMCVRVTTTVFGVRDWVLASQCCGLVRGCACGGVWCLCSGDRIWILVAGICVGAVWSLVFRSGLSGLCS